jgi:hypothetical protein
MSAEELIRNKITPQSIETAVLTALEAAKTAWSILGEEEQIARGPDYIKTLDILNTNQQLLLDKLIPTNQGIDLIQPSDALNVNSESTTTNATVDLQTVLANDNMNQAALKDVLDRQGIILEGIATQFFTISQNMQTAAAAQQAAADTILIAAGTPQNVNVSVRISTPENIESEVGID